MTATKGELKLHNFEVNPKEMVFHFHEESTVIPLSKVRSYHLKWHLHEPIFARKWWFLVLTVQLTDRQEQAGPVAFVNFNYLGDDRRTRWKIETSIADAIDAALRLQAKDRSGTPVNVSPASARLAASNSR